ncbi:MAG: ABC transporter permease [Candidatus Nitrosopolaris wilkensis]|nr:MAG: ABC transporter permease [Candidatus Nitrosopolaris wilkensis]
MNIKEIFILSFESLSDRKVRSILTILMVMVGSALLVAVGGIGASFTDAFSKQFRNLAPNILFISSSQQAQDQGPGGGVGGAGTPPPAPKITLNAAIVNRIHSLPFVSDVIPTYRASVTVQSQSESKTDSILSMDPQKLLVIAPTLEYSDGSTLQPNNPASMIVAQNVANPPGDANPFLVLGQSAKVSYSFVDSTTGQQKEESKNFIVTGIIKETGNPTIDGAIVINLQAGNSLLQKSGKFDSLFVIAQTTNFVDIVEQEIRSLYGNNIGITTVKAILKTIEQFTGQINAFLNSIAIISLVVGAVGIITTLYTAVIERTREIGTLKAIGAQNSDILALFLVEALLIGIFGASIGLLAGIGFGYGLSATVVPGNGSSPPIYTANDMARVWMISVGLSIVAGVVPALQASRLLPVQALRSQ